MQKFDGQHFLILFFWFPLLSKVKACYDVTCVDEEVVLLGRAVKLVTLSELICKILPRSNLYFLSYLSGVCLNMSILKTVKICLHVTLASLLIPS